MFKLKTIDATSGRLLPSILIYAVPLILATLVQTLFHAVDLIVLRYTADSVAIASVGATGTITTLIVHTFIGLSGGTNVILARFIGAKDHKNIHDTTSTSILMSIAIGMIASILGLIFSEPLLILTKCPADCFDGALTYLRIYFLSTPAILLYSFGASILRTSGDTTRPLIYMLLSGSLNLVMNIVLCFVLKEKVAAVAIATLASQVLGAVLTMVRLCTMKGDCRISLLKMRFSVPLFRRILRFGLPICLNTALFPIANLQIQSAINSFGSAATAGNVASINLENFVSSVTTAFGTSALTFIGQNLGAGKPDRVRKSFRLCLSISFLCGLVLGLVLYSFGDFFLSFFVGNDSDAIGYGMIRARYILVFHCIAALNSGFGATLNAFGYSAFTSLVSIIAVFGLRLVWMNFIYPFFPTFECVFVCFFVSWILMFLCNIIMIAIVFRKYKNGTLHSVS